MVRYLLHTFLLVSFCACIVLQGQTTLSAGSIGIIRMNSDAPDNFSFVLLENVDAGTTITFTEQGWMDNAASFQSNNEGHVQWTTSFPLSAGQVITIEETSSNTFSATQGIATLSSGSFAISPFGDQMFAYQGSSSNPTFLFAMQSNSTSWQTGDPTDSNQSSLPRGLTNGVNAIAAGFGSGDEQEYDNVEYDIDIAPTSGSASSLLSEITNINNWDGGNGNGNRFNSAIPNFSVGTFPVEFTDFKASLFEGRVSLQWETASEQNNAYFSVERSINGFDFEELGQMAGNGTTQEAQSYDFTDGLPKPGLNYYRIRQVDFNGDFSFSQTISIEVLYLQGEKLPMYVDGNTKCLHLPAIQQGSVHLYTLTGQKVAAHTLDGSGAPIYVGTLPNGPYLVEVVRENLPRQMQRIMK